MTDAFASLRVTDVAFNDDFILMTLADGRRTRQPLRWAPALFEATLNSVRSGCSRPMGWA